jgi:hypothetical protein
MLLPVVRQASEIAGSLSMNTVGLPIVYVACPMTVGCATPALSPLVIGMVEPMLSAFIIDTLTVSENISACAFIAMLG